MIFITFAQRGGGGLEKWPIMRPIVLIGCVKMRTRGGGGPKSRKFCERNKWMPPYVMCYTWLSHLFERLLQMMEGGNDSGSERLQRSGRGQHCANAFAHQAGLGQVGGRMI